MAHLAPGNVVLADTVPSALTVRCPTPMPVPESIATTAHVVVSAGLQASGSVHTCCDVPVYVPVLKNSRKSSTTTSADRRA